MKIGVIGTGYVGLVTGVCLAEMGHSVICIDIDKQKVGQLNQGHMTIYEPGLDLLLERNVREKRVAFSTDYARLQNMEAVFLALPTPSGSDGSADLQYIRQAAKKLAKVLDTYAVVINKSTVPVGTGDEVDKILRDSGVQSFDVVSNPEFLREGYAVDDFLKPDRIVIGTECERARKVTARIYKGFQNQGARILYMDRRSAELTKYAANAFLATKISFFNEIANIAERVGADIDDVRKAVGLDNRIGEGFTSAGIGYGGSCFPKDSKALIDIADKAGYDFGLMKATVKVNQQQPALFIDKIVRHFGPENLSRKHLTLWGLAFKPDTDDMREAPSLILIKELIKLGVSLTAYDPVAITATQKIVGDTIAYSADPYTALQKSDGLVIATEWPEFRNPDFSRVKDLMREPVIFDGRNIYDTHEMNRGGFTYYSVGRGVVQQTDAGP